ncbi:MAG: T9SS type A sorting domain-containing protein, partial [candidate division WOR-3 bacterium]
PLTATNNSHKVSRDNNGYLHLSCLGHHSPGDTIPISIWYSKSTDNGLTWAEEWVGEGKYPGLAISEDGKKVGIAYLGEGREYLLYSFRDSLGFWSPPCTIIRYIWPPRIFPKAYSPPSICFMADTIHLVSRMRSFWPSRIEYHILYWKFPFNNPGVRTMEIVDRWVITPMVPLPPGEPEPIPLCPSLALDFNQKPYIVWERPAGDSIVYPPIPPDDIFFGFKVNNQWTKSNISNSPDSSLNPSIDCYGGNVSVVWQEKVNGYAVYLRDLGYIGQADWILTDTVRFGSFSARNPTIRRNYVLWQEEDGENIQVLGRLWNGVENTWGVVEPLSGPDYISVYPHSEVWQDAGNANFFSLWTKVSDTLVLEYKLRQEPVANVSIPYYYLILGDSTPFTVYREGGVVIDSLKMDYGDSLVYSLPYVDSAAKCKLTIELYCPENKGDGGNEIAVSAITENEEIVDDEIPDLSALQQSDIFKNEKSEYRVKLEVNGIMHRNLKLNLGLNRFNFWVPAAVNHYKKAKIVFTKISGAKIYCHRILWEQYERTEEASFTGAGGVQSGERWGMPLRFYLNPVRPNPFNRRTTIEYSLAHPGNVRIKVYDVTGRVIKILKDEYQREGIYRLDWDVKEMTSGVYFIELEAGKYLNRRKIIKLK